MGHLCAGRTEPSSGHMPPLTRVRLACVQLRLAAYCIWITILITFPTALEGGPVISWVGQLGNLSRGQPLCQRWEEAGMSGLESQAHRPSGEHSVSALPGRWGQACACPYVSAHGAKPGLVRRRLPPKRTRTPAPLPPSCLWLHCLELLPRTLPTCPPAYESTKEPLVSLCTSFQSPRAPVTAFLRFQPGRSGLPPRAGTW